MKAIINQDQLLILYRNNTPYKVLDAGKHHIFNKSFKVFDRCNPIEKSNLNPIVLKNICKKTFDLERVEVKNDFIAYHFVDGVFYSILPEGIYNFIPSSHKNDFIIDDKRNVIVNETIPVSVKKQLATEKYPIIRQYVVFEGYKGVLYVNGKINQILDPGSYFVYISPYEITCKNICLKEQILNITGQEILSKDKVTLRCNLYLNYKLVDINKALINFENYENELYLRLQMKYREYFANKTLDEILSEKESMGQIVLSLLKGDNTEQELGIELFSSGIKDLILPGDIREILNTVLIAEKKAMANVITRREETASTRSLLNTAKLMEENKTLYRLKELEYLEKIFEKVQSLTLNSSESAINQLLSLINKKN